MISNNIKLYRQVIELCEYLDIDDKAFKQDVFDSVYNCETDFEVDLGKHQSWRFINEDYIDDIHEEYIKDLVNDCYLQTELPWWIAVDWSETSQNCINADGYGHSFATYDGNEYEHRFKNEELNENYYIFRTN